MKNMEYSLNLQTVKTAKSNISLRNCDTFQTRYKNKVGYTKSKRGKIWFTVGL